MTLKLYYDLTVYNVTVENDGNGSASAAPASATMGETITLTSTPNSGYRFKEWHIVSGDVTISGDVFTMPAGNVVVKAVLNENQAMAVAEILLLTVMHPLPQSEKIRSREESAVIVAS